MNRLANTKNWAQGEYKKVLCVCSAGLLRSPTAAVVLSQPPFNFNTRAAGLVSQFALIPVDQVLLEWADEIVCMEDFQFEALKDRIHDLGLKGKELICLNIDDDYKYRDERLMRLIAENYQAAKAEEAVLADDGAR